MQKLYIVLLGDGMSDYPIAELGGRTPLEYAATPNMDRLARLGQVGLVKTVPDGFKPGSDVANLSVIGYAPEKYYTGRSPLEAVSMGIKMTGSDAAVRANLVTLSGDKPVGKKTMLDYSAGEISTEEACALMGAVDAALGSPNYAFYAGVGYRHCMLAHSGVEAKLTPPHDISGKCIAEYLPSGKDGDALTALIERSGEILEKHPVNQRRIANGKSPATHVWFWGAGTKPSLPPFFELSGGLNGAVISAVDLLKGIALASGMKAPQVEGANGTLNTNYQGKLDALFDAANEGVDYVYLHVEAPDECAHQGNVRDKVTAIERVDALLGRLTERLDAEGRSYVLAVLPDHATPIALRTHTSDPVPYLIFDSERPQNSGLCLTEADAARGVPLAHGVDVLKTMRACGARG